MAGESTIEETEMRTMGYVSKPSEESVKRIYGDDYITSKKPTLRYDKYRVDKNRKLEDDDLTNRINKIRNTKPTTTTRRKRPYLDQEARRRDLRSTRTDDKTVGGGGVGIIIALVAMAVMLLIGIIIFSEVNNAMVDPRNMNTTSGYPVTPSLDPFEMLLSPFDQIKNYLGDLVGLADFPMWVLLPLIIGVVLLLMRGMSRAI